jgi:hypothetical protein
LGAAEPSGLPQDIAVCAIGKGQESFLGFVIVEVPEPLLVAEGDLVLLGQKGIEESLAGGADEIILADLPQEDPAEGVGQLDKDNLADDQGVGRDKDLLFSLYDSPVEHWSHIRFTNPIESGFSTVRHRTRQTKGAAQEPPPQPWYSDSTWEQRRPGVV